jgi:predicted ABC-type transport system involved in lysophospholipase L1 biosynthesis ATPase subunit
VAWTCASPLAARLAIAWPAGSGKTSLLLLAGLERPAAGCICFARTDLAALDAEGLANQLGLQVGDRLRFEIMG